MRSTYVGRVLCLKFWFFFFQAEDGIRDIGVTGVQTCALPILAEGGVDELHAGHILAGLDAPCARYRRRERAGVAQQVGAAVPPGVGHGVEEAEERSEERRVGKECRSRWAPDH